MNKKITIYEARMNNDYDSDAISRGEGATEIEALQYLYKSKRNPYGSFDAFKRYAVVEMVDITNEVNKYKKKADKILNKLQQILNTIPKYDSNIHVFHVPSWVPEKDARIVISHNLIHIKNQVNENYKKIFNENTIKGIFKFRQLVSYIHRNFFIRYIGVKKNVTYQFVNPFNVSQHDMIELNCRYFGNLDQDFCVDLNLKYSNEILASSFSTRDYKKKWEYNENGEIIGGGYQE